MNTATYDLTVTETTTAYEVADLVNRQVEMTEGLQVNGHRVVRPTALVQPAKGWGTGKVSVLVEGKRLGSQRMLWFAPGQPLTLSKAD